MRWIKASEHVPDQYRSVHARYTRDGKECKWTVRYNPSTGQWVTQGAEGLIEATDLEWLDESIPASIEDEAERLYPNKYKNGEGGAKGRHYMDFEIADLQRSAHITCARQYMDTIEMLRAELAAQTISKDVAVKILTVAAALINEDRDEAYHHLYKIADPTFKYIDNPWKDLESIAGVKLNELAKAMIENKKQNS